jgi:hypothetical protein
MRVRFLVLAVLGVSGCSWFSSVPVQQSTSYYPLEAGLTWTMSGILPSGSADTYIRTIPKAVQKNGHTYFEVQEFNTRIPSLGSSRLLRVGGNDTVFILNGNREEVYINFALPIDSMILTTDPDYTHVWIGVESRTDSARTAFGTFRNCVTIFYAPEYITDADWTETYAKGIGLVESRAGGLSEYGDSLTSFTPFNNSPPPHIGGDRWP